MKPPILKSLKLKEIEIADLQARAATDDKTIEEYAEAFQDGAKFPAAVVFHDGKIYFLADGFHRYFAAKEAGLADLLCDVREGTRKDALWFAVGANRTHGLKRTNADKRNAVEMALRERPEMADNAIAQHVGVSWDLVKTVRSTIVKQVPVPEPEKRVGFDGKRYPTPPPPVIPNLEKSGPSTKKLPPLPSVPSSEKSAPKTPPPPIVVPVVKRDRNGCPIPKSILPLWDRAEEASTMLSTISSIRGMLRKAEEDKDRAFAEVNFSSAQSELDGAYAALKVLKPHSVCTACKGLTPDSCTLCFHKGFISEFRWNTVPIEAKEIWLKTMCKK